MNKYSLFFGLCNQAELSEAERYGAIRCESGQRTESIKELSVSEYNNLVMWVKEVEAKRNKPMRGKIIYYMTTLGYTKGNGLPDWEAIDNYVKRHGGESNPKKKGLQKLKTSELRGVLIIVQKFYQTKFAKALK